LCSGFAAYLASNAAFYYSPVVRAQYAARNHGLAPTVQFNDIMFALHALALSVITTSQYLGGARLWRFTSSTISTRPSRLILGVASGSMLGVLLTWFLVVGARRRHSPAGDAGDAAADWCELDVVYALGYVKLVITLIKYTPQLVANYRNKSTRGWSIAQILFDLGGGVLSVAQLGIDSWLQGDWSGVTGNPVKLALGNASMVYDSLFMVQHYVLYRKRAPEEARLLPDEERRDRID
jgi:cystinosin